MFPVQPIAIHTLQKGIDVEPQMPGGNHIIHHFGTLIFSFVCRLLNN